MLLTGLHGHTVSNIAVFVLRYANDSAWHLSLELILASKISRVRSTETHGDSESLDATTGDIATHLTSSLADWQGKDILDHDRANLLLTELFEKLGVVLHVSNVVRGLNDGSTELLCLIPRESFYVTKDKLDS